MVNASATTTQGYFTTSSSNKWVVVIATFKPSTYSSSGGRALTFMTLVRAEYEFVRIRVIRTEADCFHGCESRAALASTKHAA